MVKVRRGMQHRRPIPISNVSFQPLRKNIFLVVVSFAVLGLFFVVSGCDGIAANQETSEERGNMEMTNLSAKADTAIQPEEVGAPMQIETATFALG